jgi:hypothetical protein
LPRCLLVGACRANRRRFSILNVAMPQIGAGVGLGLAGLPWVATAFVLPAPGFTLVFGRLADLFGRRRLFQSGMALLVAASLLGGLAANAVLLLTARTLQGFATAMTLPADLSLLTTGSAEGAERDRVLGLNGALLSGGFTVGALAGGTLVGWLSWRAAFFLNVPVAASILLVTPFVITESTGPDGPVDPEVEQLDRRRPRVAGGWHPPRPGRGRGRHPREHRRDRGQAPRLAGHDHTRYAPVRRRHLSSGVGFAALHTDEVAAGPTSRPALGQLTRPRETTTATGLALKFGATEKERPS